MAKKKDRTSRGKARTPQRRPSRPPRTPPVDDAADQELLVGLRSALRTGDAADLLSKVSALVEVTTHRRPDPFGSAPTVGGPSLAELVTTFTEHSYAETTAALTAIRLLVPDDVLAARIGRELAGRPADARLADRADRRPCRVGRVADVAHPRGRRQPPARGADAVGSLADRAGLR